MTTEANTPEQRRSADRRLLLLLLLVAGLAACGDRNAGEADAAADSPAETADSLTIDLMAPGGPAVNSSAVQPTRRPRGDTVSVTAALTEYSIAVSSDTVESGDFALLIENGGERPHTIELRGDNGMRWVSLPIRPGGALTMTMSIEPGHYVVRSTDSAYVERGMRGEFHVR